MNKSRIALTAEEVELVKFACDSFSSLSNLEQLSNAIKQLQNIEAKILKDIDSQSEKSQPFNACEYCAGWGYGHIGRKCQGCGL